MVDTRGSEYDCAVEGGPESRYLARSSEKRSARGKGFCMSPTQDSKYLDALQDFADSITDAYSSNVRAQPEDQLKTPVTTLLKEFGATMDLDIRTLTETPVEDLGRLDISVETNHLLTGHMELKRGSWECGR